MATVEDKDMLINAMPTANYCIDHLILSQFTLGVITCLLIGWISLSSCTIGATLYLIKNRKRQIRSIVQYLESTKLINFLASLQDCLKSIHSSISLSVYLSIFHNFFLGSRPFSYCCPPHNTLAFFPYASSLYFKTAKGGMRGGEKNLHIFRVGLSGIGHYN